MAEAPAAADAAGEAPSPPGGAAQRAGEPPEDGIYRPMQRRPKGEVDVELRLYKGGQEWLNMRKARLEKKRKDQLREEAALMAQPEVTKYAENFKRNDFQEFLQFQTKWQRDQRFKRQSEAKKAKAEELDKATPKGGWGWKKAPGTELILEGMEHYGPSSKAGWRRGFLSYLRNRWFAEDSQAPSFRPRINPKSRRLARGQSYSRLHGLAEQQEEARQLRALGFSPMSARTPPSSPRLAASSGAGTRHRTPPARSAPPGPPSPPPPPSYSSRGADWDPVWEVGCSPPPPQQQQQQQQQRGAGGAWRTPPQTAGVPLSATTSAASAGGALPPPPPRGPGDPNAARCAELRNLISQELAHQEALHVRAEAAARAMQTLRAQAHADRARVASLTAAHAQATRQLHQQRLGGDVGPPHAAHRPLEHHYDFAEL